MRIHWILLMIDLFYLHIFIPQINENLMSFTLGWNNHQISTEIRHLCNYISRKVREGLAVWIQLVQRIADVELLGGRYIWCPAQTIWHIDSNHKLIRW